MAYGYKKTLTIDHTKCAAGTLSSFPVMFSNTDVDFKTVANGGKVNNTVSQTGGASITIPADLIFTSDATGTTKIPWEYKFYSATTGQLVVFFQVGTLPSTAGADLVVYCFFGDAAVNTQQNTGSFSPSNVWDTNYKGVYHLGDGSSLNTQDSTSGGLGNGTNIAASATSGKNDGAGSFSAGSKGIGLANPTVHYSSITLEAWFQSTTLTPPDGNSFIVGKGFELGTSSIEYELSCGRTSGKMTFSCYNGSFHGVNPSSASFTTNTWTHVVGTFDGTNWKLYVNGSIDTTVSDATHPTNSVNYSIGFDDFSGNNERLSGKIEEVRISNIARTADYVTANYNNQNAPTTFVIMGATTANSASSIVNRRTLGPRTGSRSRY